MTTTPMQRGLRIDLDGSMTEVAWSPAEGGLRAMQDAVGGAIELVALRRFGLALVINERGKCRDGWEREINPYGTALYLAQYVRTGWLAQDAIVGPVLLIALDPTPQGDCRGLSASQFAALRRFVAEGVQPQAA